MSAPVFESAKGFKPPESVRGKSVSAGTAAALSLYRYESKVVKPILSLTYTSLEFSLITFSTYLEKPLPSTAVSSKDTT